MTRHSAPALIATLAGTALLLAGCTPATTTVEDSQTAEFAPAGAAASLIASPDETTRAIEASTALFAHAPLVVVAASGDEAGQALAAQLGVGLGAPVLVAPSVNDGGDAAVSAVGDELNRLGAEHVMAVGDVGEIGADVDVRDDIGATREDVDAAGGVEISDGLGEKPVASLAGSFDDGNARDGLIALAEEGAASVPAAATALAAGVPVHPIPAGTTDILRSSDAVAAIEGSGASSTFLIGSSLADQPDPDWSVRAARGGPQLPGGTLRMLGEHRFVAMYGVPGVAELGVLGEQGPAETVKRAASIAKEYDEYSDLPVVPTLEIIATVAAGAAGSDGNYSNELPLERLEPLVDAATKAGQYVIIDLQPGRTDFLTQAKQYRSLLERPGVGLALDPEWRLGPDEVPLEQIGSVGAGEVNDVSEWLAELVNEKSLPPKMLVLHQFRLSMLGDRDKIRTDHPELEVVIHADGQGGQPDKQATWRALHVGAPKNIGWGWKNFYDEDHPMLTPEQTIRDVDPLPDLISYQ